MIRGKTPFIKVGYKMKKWIGLVILRDFGNKSIALGLYHIIRLYNKYVPKWERDKVKMTRNRRVRG